MNGNLGGDGGRFNLFLLVVVNLRTKMEMMNKERDKYKVGFTSNGKCCRSIVLVPSMAVMIDTRGLP